MEDLESFFGEDVDYVAPEVLSHGAVDDRSDVYSLGKFMQSLFTKGDMPMAYRRVLQKAVSTKPEDRYETPAEMLKAVKKSQEVYKSVIAFIAAAVIALVIWVAYFDAFPETSQVEFVKPAPRQATDDLLEDGFDPSELGVVSADSLTDEEKEAQRNYEAKAEAIFRKKFEQEADRILSKIYNKTYMSNSEKQFMSESESTTQELMMLQQDLGAEANLDPTRSQLIASEIIERLTEQKKKEMGGTNSRAIQK
jgi:serine/threonine protein kinase